MSMKPRKVGLYFAWSRPAEIQVDLGVLENRYPTLFEFRRALWPRVEALKNPQTHAQSVQGFLDHVILSDFERFRTVVKEATGQEVEVIQRLGDQPPARELDRDFLDRFDTLIVVSLDHFRTQQEATAGELDALRDFLRQEDRCLFLCPHHDLGAASEPDSPDPAKQNLAQQLLEHTHHGDSLVPGQQRIGGFARSIFKGLGLPVENCWGLSPASMNGQPAPLKIEKSALDTVDLALLDGVDTFNLHPHLPHLDIAPGSERTVEVLARQAINPGAAPHPFVTAGNQTFNALVRAHPIQVGGRIYVNDATLWSSAFGGDQSLIRFWQNLARMRR